MMRGDSPIRLSRDEFARLVLIDPEGVRHVGVIGRPRLPDLGPGRWAWRSATAKGAKFTGSTTSPRCRPRPASRSTTSWRRSQFLPTILRILRISGDATPCEFEVETDRGPTRFTLDSDEQIRSIGPDRFILTDARGVRYHVPDLAEARRRESQGAWSGICSTADLPQWHSP